MEARDDLRYAGRATGQLEAQHVLASEVNLLQPFACFGQWHPVDQSGETVQPRRRRAANDHDVLQRPVLLRHALSEADQVECSEVGLHEVATRADCLRQLADLHLAVLRQRAHRHDACLVAGKQHDRGVDGGAQLKDGAVAGIEPDLEQGGA